MSSPTLMPEDELIDRFLDALARDPHAPAPLELDAGTAAFVRALARAGQVDMPAGVVQRRVWLRALAGAGLSPTAAGPGAQPSANGKDPSAAMRAESSPHANYPVEEFKEFVIMDSTLVAAPRRMSRRRFWAVPFTLAAAVLAVVVFGALLASHINLPVRPDVAGGASAQRATATLVWTPTALPPTVAPSAPPMITATPIPVNPPGSPGPTALPPTVWASPAFPIDAIPIRVGETVSGALTAERPEIAYAFTAESDIAVIARLTTADFQPVLSTFVRSIAPDGSSYGSASDAPDPRFLFLALKAGEQSALKVSALQVGALDGGSGGFTLSLERAPDIVRLAYGETVEREITGSERFFVFAGAAGDVVSLRVESGGSGDTRLRLLSPHGDLLLLDEDSGPGYDPEINHFALYASMDYFLVVEPAVMDEAGRFRLSLVLEGQQPTPSPIVMPAKGMETVSIRIGDTVVGRLTAAMPEITYSLETASDTRLVVFLYSTDFIPGLSHVVIYRADGGGGGGGGGSGGGGGGGDSTTGAFDASLVTFIEAAAGAQVWLTVRAEYGTLPNGDFTLSVQSPESIPHLAYGETAQGELTHEIPMQVFAFDVSANDTVSIRVDSDGAMDSRLRLLSPWGGELFSDDNSGSGYDPEITDYLIMEAGTHYLVVQPAQPDQAGAFTLTLSKSARQGVPIATPSATPIPMLKLTPTLPPTPTPVQ